MHRTTSRRYIQRNREKLNRKTLALYYADKEVWRKRARDFRKKNPEKARAKGRADEAKRRAKKKNVSINDLTKEQWEEILIAYHYKCVYCGKRSKKLTMDHITALTNNGGHTTSNVVPACKSCNSRKGAKGVPIPIQPVLLTIAPKRQEAS